MLNVYHRSGTRSVRPIWLCHELDLPVEVHTIDFSSSFLNSPEWRAISPAGKIPVLTDGALTMFESGAMVEYILDRYGNDRLRPAAGTQARAIHQQWCWFSEATLARPLGISQIVRAGSAEEFAEAGRAKLQTCLNAVNDTLEHRRYLMGDDFTAADVMMGYSLELLHRFEVLDDRAPAAQRYLTDLKSRAACQRALAV